VRPDSASCPQERIVILDQYVQLRIGLNEPGTRLIIRAATPSGRTAGRVLGLTPPAVDSLIRVLRETRRRFN